MWYSRSQEVSVTFEQLGVWEMTVGNVTDVWTGRPPPRHVHIAHCKVTAMLDALVGAELLRLSIL